MKVKQFLNKFLYLSFENFALLTPVNGIPAYNIDDFATSEEQAKTSFEEVRTQVLEANEAKMRRKFDWTKESIQYPLAEAEQRGHLTFVDEPDMEPSLVVDWLQEQRKKYKFIYGAIDHYRFTLMGKYLKAAGFIPQKGKEDGNYKLTYLPEQSAIAPSLKKAFNADAIIWGENSLMRWYVGNTKQVVDKKGNVTFEKIEPKSRKTDGFMAFVAAFIVSDRLEPYQQQRPRNLGVYTYG